MIRWYILLLIFSLAIASCQKEPAKPNEPNASTGSGVFICNEGGFGFGNASVSFYDLEKDSLSDQLFQRANGRPLGDVLQSMYIRDSLAYLLVNNSNKIEVVRVKDFKSVATIEGLISPRYFLPVNADKAYVSDLYADVISVVDLERNEITGTISLKGWSEEMALSGTLAFVTVRENRFLYMLDTELDQVVDSIEVGFNPSSIQQDKNGMLWVLCSGDQGTGEVGGLYQVDPNSESVLRILAFSDTEIGGWPRLRINGSRDTLYYLKEAVFQFPIGNANLPEEALIPADDRIFYGLGIHPETGKVFVSDVIDYQQKGVIYCYDQEGSLLRSFKAGVIPNDFVFYEQ